MHPTRTADLVIFDCDGVLIDSETLSAKCFAATLAEHGIRLGEDEIHARFTGHSEPVTRSMLQASYPRLDVETVLATTRSRLAASFAADLALVPGIEAVVRGLTVPCCVASNSGVRRLRESLGLFPLWHAFGNHIYSAEMVPRPKPAPDLLNLCLAQTGTAPGRAVMIDDNPQGVAAARAAGLVAIGFVLPSDPRPDRAEVLRAAGADLIAHGAGMLGDQLAGLTRQPAALA